MISRRNSPISREPTLLRLRLPLTSFPSNPHPKRSSNATLLSPRRLPGCPTILLTAPRPRVHPAPPFHAPATTLRPVLQVLPRRLCIPTHSRVPPQAHCPATHLRTLPKILPLYRDPARPRHLHARGARRRTPRAQIPAPSSRRSPTITTPRSPFSTSRTTQASPRSRVSRAAGQTRTCGVLGRLAARSGAASACWSA